VRDLRSNRFTKDCFTFLHKSVGIAIGPKVNVVIPSILKDPGYIKYFIRGLADADFSLSFKRRNKLKHYYPVVSFCSRDHLLVSQVNDILTELGFKTLPIFDFTKKRYKKVHISSQIELNGVESLGIIDEKNRFQLEKTHN